MQYTKVMIEQVFEIRKVAPQPLKSKIKLSDPNLFGILAEAYNQLQDSVLKQHIERLMSFAGPNWSALLDSQNPAESRKSSKTYRGQEVTTKTDQQAISPITKKQIIYRGQLVYN